MSFIVFCIFCRRPHESEFFDEIEEQILRCRDAAPEHEKGLLRDCPDKTTPRTVEEIMAIAEIQQLEREAREVWTSYV
jgi:hypothetical protein